MSRDPDHAPYKDDLSSAAGDLLPIQTKFEVSNYTYYEDMKSRAKCRNWGNMGRLGIIQGHRVMSPFDEAHTTSYSTSTETVQSILYLFRDIASYLSKVADYNPPQLHLAPHRG